MKKLNLILIIITLALSSFFTACSNKNSNNRYEVYYFDPVAKELIIRKVVIKEDDTISVAEQLFSKLKESSEKMQSVCPDYLNLEKIEIEKKIMNVYLSEGYINMNNVERAVFEAGTVKTLCQIADIEYIHLFSGGQPVIDEKGMDRGLLSNRSFITTDRIGDDEDTYFTTILYFADSSGTMLVGEKTDIIFSSNYLFDLPIPASAISP